MRPDILSGLNRSNLIAKVMYEQMKLAYMEKIYNIQCTIKF